METAGFSLSHDGVAVLACSNRKSQPARSAPDQPLLYVLASSPVGLSIPALRRWHASDRLARHACARIHTSASAATAAAAALESVAECLTAACRGFGVQVTNQDGTDPPGARAAFVIRNCSGECVCA